MHILDARIGERNLCYVDPWYRVILQTLTCHQNNLNVNLRCSLHLGYKKPTF